MTEPFVEITLYNADELAERLSHAREYLLGAINASLRECGRMLVPRFKEATPVGATGHLKQYTVYQVMGSAEDMYMEVRQSARSPKGFAYGAAVRTGTKPHFPPVEALVPWVIKKLHVEEGEARSVAFLIARKISKVGTKPQPYHIKVIEQSIGEIKQIMEKAAIQLCVRIADIPSVNI